MLSAISTLHRSLGQQHKPLTHCHSVVSLTVPAGHTLEEAALSQVSNSAISVWYALNLTIPGPGPQFPPLKNEAGEEPRCSMRQNENPC